MNELEYDYCYELVQGSASNQTYEEFMEIVFRRKVQKEFRDKAEKVYLFRDLEIRKIELQRQTITYIN